MGSNFDRERGRQPSLLMPVDTAEQCSGVQAGFTAALLATQRLRARLGPSGSCRAGDQQMSKKIRCSAKQTINRMRETEVLLPRE